MIILIYCRQQDEDLSRKERVCEVKNLFERINNILYGFKPNRLIRNSLHTLLWKAESNSRPLTNWGLLQNNFSLRKAVISSETRNDDEAVSTVIQRARKDEDAAEITICSRKSCFAGDPIPFNARIDILVVIKGDIQ